MEVIVLCRFLQHCNVCQCSYASIGAFAFAFFGAAFPKIFSCIPGISEIVALSYIRSATAACLVGLGFCFAAFVPCFTFGLQAMHNCNNGSCSDLADLSCVVVCHW